MLTNEPYSLHQKCINGDGRKQKHAEKQGLIQSRKSFVSAKSFVSSCGHFPLKAQIRVRVPVSLPKIFGSTPRCS